VLGTAVSGEAISAIPSGAMSIRVRTITASVTDLPVGLCFKRTDNGTWFVTSPASEDDQPADVSTGPSPAIGRRRESTLGSGEEYGCSSVARTSMVHSDSLLQLRIGRAISLENSRLRDPAPTAVNVTVGQRRRKEVFGWRPGKAPAVFKL
jgi:hypothetical protein